MQYLVKILIFITLLISIEASVASSYRITAILKLQDAYSDYPKDILASMKFALKTIKTKNKITLEVFSHDGSPESINSAVIAAKKSNPDIIIGGETSQTAMIIAKAFSEKIFVTPTASTNKLTEVHPAPIRMIHPDEQYVSVVAHVIKNRPTERIGILHNISYPNTELIGESIIAYLRTKNITPVIVTTQTGEEIDSKKLKPFVDANIDTLAIFSFETDLRKTYSVLSKNQVYPLYIGADGWGRDSSLRENLLSGEGKHFSGIRTLYWNTTRTDAFFRKTIKALEAAQGKKPDAFHAIGYDTMKLIIENLNNIQHISSFVETLKARTYHNFLTTSMFKYSSELVPVKDFHIYELRNGLIKYKEKISP